MSAFEYPSAGAAAADAAKIAADGSGTTGGGCAALITAQPRFYRRDRVMAVYAGTDETVLRPLGAVLAAPFTMP